MLMKKQTKTRRKKSTNGGVYSLNWHSFNHALTTLEKQAEWAYTQFKHTLPKNWEKKIDQFTSKDIVNLARKKRSMITKEVKHYTDGIVDTISRADFLSNKNHLVKEARKNFNTFLKKLQKSDVAHKAKDIAANKGEKVLSLLNFPTKKEVAKLNARLGQIEKQLRNLSTSTSSTPTNG